MRIVILAGYAPSLVNFRGELLGELVRAGHSVVALAPDFDELTIGTLNKVGVVSKHGGFNRSGINIFRDFINWIQLVKILIDLKPELFIGYTIKPVIFGTLASVVSGVPRRVSMITGLGYAFVGESLMQKIVGFIAGRLYRISISFNEHIFFQNADDLNLFQRKGILGTTRSTVINGSGVNIEKFAFTEIPEGSITFLMVARLYREKGIYEFIEAARSVKSRYPATRFVLVGAPDSNPHSLKLDEITAWTEENLIEYHGWQQDVQPYYKSCSVFVLPSYREGLPRSVIEAMAIGRPIITTDAPGCRDTVIPEENGWLVPVKSSAELANAMLDAIEKQSILSRMGQASRSIAELQFDVRDINRCIFNSLGLKPAKLEENSIFYSN